MEYPQAAQSPYNKWVETYIYDANGQVTSQTASPTDSSVSHNITNTFVYDNNGNILNETRNGAGGQAAFNRTHVYDVLNRLTSTTGLPGNKSYTYQYDSLGNLLYEKNGNGANKGNEYWYDSLNRQIKKLVDNKDEYQYTFDGRGNLTSGAYHKNKNHSTLVEQYTYDATNRMVKGDTYNDTSVKYEESHYIYNGFGDLVGKR